MVNLGKWIHNYYSSEYTSRTSVTDVVLDDDRITARPPEPQGEGLTDEYVPTRVRFESSAYDTTIVSAQSISRGLFPSKEHGIPIYTQEDRNDITIAAADQCPSFLQQIGALDRGEDSDWNGMENAYMDLLQRLGQIPILSAYATATIEGTEERYVPLQNVWKVYDMIREAKITCNQGYDTTNFEICQNLPFPDSAALLNDIEWDDLQTLARYTEVQAKYGTESASLVIAGNLLRKIADRMVDDEMSSPDNLSSKRVYVSSADYETLIALMAALEVQPDDQQWEEAFPGYGAAIIVELYQDTDTYEHTVRFLYKAAGQATPSILRLGHLCFEKDYCSMMTFTAQLQEILLGTDAWCQACGNDTSDLCLFYSRLSYQEQLRDEMAMDESLIQNITQSDNPAETLKALTGLNACPDDESIRRSFLVILIVGVALGVGLTVIFALIIQFILKRLRKSKRMALTGENLKLSVDAADSPITPKTIDMATPMRFFQSKFKYSPRAKSPPSHVDLDADGLSLSDEECDHSNHFRAPASPQRPTRSSLLTLPSKEEFPPLIV